MFIFCPLIFCVPVFFFTKKNGHLPGELLVTFSSIFTKKNHVYKVPVKYCFFPPCVLRDEWGTGGFGWGKVGSIVNKLRFIQIYNCTYLGFCRPSADKSHQKFLAAKPPKIISQMTSKFLAAKPPKISKNKKVAASPPPFF